jgi:hypothetical protein
MMIALGSDSNTEWAQSQQNIYVPAFEFVPPQLPEGEIPPSPKIPTIDIRFDRPSYPGSSFLVEVQDAPPNTNVEVTVANEALAPYADVYTLYTDKYGVVKAKLPLPQAAGNTMVVVNAGQYKQFAIVDVEFLPEMKKGETLPENVGVFQAQSMVQAKAATEDQTVVQAEATAEDQKAAEESKSMMPLLLIGAAVVAFMMMGGGGKQQ